MQYLFAILTAIVHLSIQTVIFHSAREKVSVLLTIVNTKKYLIVINTD